MATAAITRSYSAEPDIRLEDYIDDKLQSTTDLENLDTLLANIELQRSQLQTQLEDATQELASVRQSAQDRQGGLTKQIEEFEKLQESIDTRMQIVAASDAPDEAIRRLEVPMRQLHKIELAQNYIRLLQDVEEWRSEARSHLPQSPKAALEPYSRLKRLAVRLKELSRAADEAAGHLVGHVEHVTASLWDEMKATMSEEFSAVLKSRNWPQDVDPDSEMDAQWIQAFEKLIDLQVPEVLYSDTVVPLLPIDVMAKPFIQWFRFQFMGTNPTSTPQAFGTFCAPNFVSLIEKWEDFFRDNVGHVLASRFQGTPVAEKAVYIDPACALITSLLPIMRQKVDDMVQHGLRNPQFLSGLIVSLMNLDDTIRSRFRYDGGDPESGWPGLTSEVLDKHFRTWLEAEKDFALQRFKTIMSSQDVWNIDYDYSPPGKMKPTYGAVRVTDLLKSVTSQYERLRRLPHKIRFLIDIQQEILDNYHDRLLDSLEAYSSRTSTVARTLGGVSKDEQLEGTGKFETLCKVLGSSDHIVNTLKDWGNEEFFVTLWEELRRRARESDDQTNLVGGMSYEHVRGRTSSEIDSDGDGTIFDETIKFYSRRRDGARGFLAKAVIESNRSAFNSYLIKPQWSIVGGETLDDPSQLAVTAELDEPLRTMKRDLTFLSSALSAAVFRRTIREALESLQETLWSGILVSKSFTGLGAAQFARDLQAIFGLVDRFISDGSASMTQLREGAELLSLPVEVEEGMPLQDAYDRVFKDNAEARQVLEELGLDALDPNSARSILRRRVEAR